jgi:ferric-dicitrate binding protein FerR (iron transport regulator)
MALSKYEQEALDQIELGLRPGGLTVPAQRPTRTRSGRSRRRMLAAAAAITVGLAFVLAGLVSKAIVVSVLGFLLIVAATMAVGSSPVSLWSQSKRTKVRR